MEHLCGIYATLGICCPSRMLLNALWQRIDVDGWFTWFTWFSLVSGRGFTRVRVDEATPRHQFPPRRNDGSVFRNSAVNAAGRGEQRIYDTGGIVRNVLMAAVNYSGPATYAPVEPVAERLNGSSFADHSRGKRDYHPRLTSGRAPICHACRCGTRNASGLRGGGGGGGGRDSTSGGIMAPANTFAKRTIWLSIFACRNGNEGARLSIIRKGRDREAKGAMRLTEVYLSGSRE